ncbi:hypothetical protein [Gordonia sp. SL306]|uniref:hypothetical protein n=1 Tax=Gordonia sp. SL306 TaxID=2995145 RepID=UPI00227159E3|nr:hypothetical protein [Gordonia sp. SL306]WAC54256.1 hypothetical protein OVA31_16385 [Gordonia sp. SL306]
MTSGLYPDATVIRAGKIRDAEILGVRVENAVRDGYGPVVSVFCDVDRSASASGMTLFELCIVSRIPHSTVQLTTVSRLAEQGFELELDTTDGQARTHHQVTMTWPVEQSELARFVACFDEPILNPTGGKVPQ